MDRQTGETPGSIRYRGSGNEFKGRTSGGGAVERGGMTWVPGVTSLLSVVWASLGAWNKMPVCLGRGETPEGDRGSIGKVLWISI